MGTPGGCRTGCWDPWRSPAGSVGEDDVAVLVVALQEGDTRVLLPVPHGLPEDGSLAACGGGAVSKVFGGGETEARRAPPPQVPWHQHSPLKLPLIT